MAPPKIETAEQLEEIVDQQTQRLDKQAITIHATGELVRAMDERIKLQQALIDTIYGRLVEAGLAPARQPEEAPPIVH